MIVWVPIECVPEVPTEVIGVYSSKEKAEASQGMHQWVAGPFNIME